MRGIRRKSRAERANALLAALFVLLACAGCRSIPEMPVMHSTGPFRIDGKLDEHAYAAVPPLKSFVIAGDAEMTASPTRAWVFWQEDQLLLAFECTDKTIVAAAPSNNERDVDGQDRVELFLWSGNPHDAYYCLEFAARGALHDYQSRFYRCFDSSWKLPGLQYAAELTAQGYCVEAALSRSALQQCGFQLNPGTQFRAGLFRADFSTAQDGVEPLWITWVDARTPKPDFHVAGSFGRFRLSSDARPEH